MRQLILGLGLLLASLSTASAQTNYPLPNSSCSVQASSYLYCSSMGDVTINGTPYSAFLSAVEITNIYQDPASAPVVLSSGSFNLQNINTGAISTMTFTSGTYNNYHLTLGFTGAFNGTINLDLSMSIGYRGRHFWTAENVVLTVN